MTASTEPRVPDFFIVGHPKSGTTALYEMLRAHPQIFMPELKEPRYFATDLRPRFAPEHAPGSTALKLPDTLEEYLALFTDARAGQRIGEATPSYLRSRTAAALIAQARPDARIVAILREPASFLRSLHLELVQNHVERETDLRKAFANERAAVERAAADGDARAGGEATAQPLPRYSDRVRYVEQLRRYRAVFAEEQVLVLIYDDFRSDNVGTVRKVLRFLEVDDTVAIEATDANPTVHVRSVRLDRAVRALYAGQGPVMRRVKSAVKTLTPASLHGDTFLRARQRLVYGAPRPVDEQFMLELRRRFRGEVQALSEYLGRDLIRLWGYDSQ